VPDVDLRKRNHKWVKLKGYRGAVKPEGEARAVIKVTFTMDFLGT